MRLAKSGLDVEDESGSDDNEVNPIPINPEELFPELKDAKHTPANKRLYFEEDSICKRLLDKHGDDYDRMARDIKVNYLQWSTG